MAGGQDMPGGKTRDQWNRQEQEITRLTAEGRAARNALAAIHNDIPTSWLDPLLSGPDAVISGECSNVEVEKLLRGLKERVRKTAARVLDAPASGKRGHSSDLSRSKVDGMDHLSDAGDSGGQNE